MLLICLHFAVTRGTACCRKREGWQGVTVSKTLTFCRVHVVSVVCQAAPEIEYLNSTLAFFSGYSGYELGIF